ncbi:F5/8 type C domain-containing protein [Desulfonatronum thiosulfatophilum]|uniref:F5/8 type C domain-containing protein n=1 Tax=Desulfonatronum thiosulfatophilum TaxID=617002 RepID=A0A1G6EP17_9BACT|nr:discoidin domain-containing protein [Desulfonatronum thiosulfatophilum]SDB59273.1 F5/8 type C domain-containing protein [Desulfonatronum thiosulfatophilum]
MKKRIVPTNVEADSGPEGDWMDLETAAEVEISSEDPNHPIEHALLPGNPSGWRAGQPGEQTIRIMFAEPRTIRRIWIHFEEAQVERTHEFVLRWSPDNGQTYKDIVRQQWNFSPSGMHYETENIYIDLNGVTTLELNIKPDISDGDAIASLAQMRVG